MATNDCIATVMSVRISKTATILCIDDYISGNYTNALNTTSDVTSSIDPKDIPFVQYMEDIKKLNINVVNTVTYAVYSMGLIANLLLLSYLIRFKRYTSPTFMLIMNLCVCDAGTCLGAIAFAAATMPVVVGPAWVCTVCVWLSDYFYCCSVVHLVFFSILRFYQLVYPLGARARITASLVAKVSILLWTISAGLVVLILLYYKAVTFHYKGKLYMLCTTDADKILPILMIATIYLLVPDILIAGFHLAKHCAVRQQARKQMSDQSQEQQRHTTDARAVTIVIVLFWVTSVPTLAHTYLHYLFGYPFPQYHLILAMVFVNLLYGNSPLNPFVYVFCAKTIRQDIMLMLKLRKRLKDDPIF